MADITVKILEPATSDALVSLDEAKVFLGISAADTSSDAQLQMAIDWNSSTIAELCNRPGTTFGYQKVRETWRCMAPICCPDGSCRIYLTAWPVLEVDIESVVTGGYTLLPEDYELEEESGKLTLFGGCTDEIVVVYSGGFKLPEESPNALKQALGLLARSSRTEAAAEATSGVRMIAHKESRIMFHPPAKGTTSSSSGSTSGATQQVKGLLTNYIRIYV
jgi:hypothetical protein